MEEGRLHNRRLHYRRKVCRGLGSLSCSITSAGQRRCACLIQRSISVGHQESTRHTVTYLKCQHLLHRSVAHFQGSWIVPAAATRHVAHCQIILGIACLSIRCSGASDHASEGVPACRCSIGCTAQAMWQTSQRTMRSSCDNFFLRGDRASSYAPDEKYRGELTY